MSKYPKTLGRIESVWNKLGGEEGVDQFLSGLTRVVSSKLISIDRHIGWKDGFLPVGLWTIAESDPRSRRLTAVDLRAVRLIPRPLDDSPNLTGEEKLELLKRSGEIRLDAGILHEIMKDTRVIPDSWKGREIYFDGDVFLTAGGHERTVLCLRFSEGRNFWSYRSESLKRICDTPQWSAVL